VQCRLNINSNTNLNPEVRLEDIISTNDVLMQPQNIAINYHQNENEMVHLHPTHVESSRKLIFDTNDLFSASIPLQGLNIVLPVKDKNL
jgi:hypothetical protein